MKERELIEIIRKIGIDGAKYIEENIDLQFFAIKKLYEKLKDPELLVKLVLLNSVVSYQLNCTGENWWMEFSNYFIENEIKNLINDYIEFLKKSECNRRLINIKINRIKKIKEFINTLNSIDYFYKNMTLLRDKIAYYLNSKVTSKTICFSVKMFGYASRIVFNEFIPYPFEVDIPLDSRIIKYTMQFAKKDYLNFWRRVAYQSGVPPLHIDSIIWPFITRNPEIFEKLNNFDKKSLVFLLFSRKIK